jgi:hypothetical protein
MTHSDAPIFIAGLAHSGKTQLRLVLDAHPDISMTRRTDMWNRFYGRFGNLQEPENFERCLRALLTDVRVARLHPDENRIRREFYGGKLEYACLFGIVHRQYAEHIGRRRWGEQQQQIERYADAIFDAFPDARMIHMVRDPRALRTVETSSRRRKGSLGWETARWLDSIELARRNQWAYSPGYRVVTYEALALDTDATMRSVCKWLGEEYTHGSRRAARSLRFDATARAVDRLELSFVDSHAGPSISALGYPRVGQRLTTSERVRYVVTEWPVNRAAMAAWHTAGRRFAHRVGAS